jgi:hypothetical protein
VRTRKFFRTCYLQSIMTIGPKRLKKNGEEKKKPGPKVGVPKPLKPQAVLKGEGKRKAFNVQTKLAMLKEMREKRMSQGVAAEYFSVDQGTVSRWVKEEPKWLAQIEETPVAANACRVKTVKFPVLEKVLSEWVMILVTMLWTL